MHLAIILMSLGLMHMAIHELGHVLVAYVVGAPVKRVGFSWRGPYMVRGHARSLERNMAVTMAGPAINVLTWIFLLCFNVPHAWVALYIGVFNLLPIPHSDMTKTIDYFNENEGLPNAEYDKTH